MPIRIYALAKQLKLDSKQLIGYCSLVRITDKGSALASLTDEETVIVTTFIKRLRENVDDTLASLLPNAPRHLSLSRMQLSRFPEVLYRFTSLQVLDLSHNQITSLPESIGQVEQLRELDLSDNRLSALPESLRKLKSLEKLHLSGNLLRSLPAVVAHHTRLGELNVSGNQLELLPRWLGKLGWLSRLDVSANQLTTVPEAVSELIRLEALDVSNNRLTTLPASLGRLTSLRHLNLSNNTLARLPESVGELHVLLTLNVAGNLLLEIPSSVQNLAELQDLNLADNRLAQLPSSLQRLSALKTLFLHGNDGLAIPPEILGPDWRSIHGDVKPSAPSDILRYLEKRQEVRRKLREAKVLLVGQGSVGKTSLLRRLRKGRFQPDEPQTEGINIVTWEISGSDLPPVVVESARLSQRAGRKHRLAQHDLRRIVAGSGQHPPIRVNAWDFGGQEIMHATHQFFLTKRSLYVVVIDARAGEQEGNLHYWLKTVQTYGGYSPVLIVVNKCEPPHHLAFDERRLKLDYAPNVVGIHYVSCRTGRGIDALCREFEQCVRGLRHVNDELPQSYFEVKRELEHRAAQEDFITQEEYLALCCQYGVTEATDQQQLLQFLHDLGAVLHYDDPRQVYQVHDTNVLNPEWVTTGVYRVIMNHELRARADGKVPRAKLGQIIGNPRRYPPERHRFLVDLMRKFDLCFEFPDESGLLLFPELLSANEPDIGWNIGQVLDFQIQYSVLPRGLLPKFSVRTHHLLTERPTCWRSGVVLRVHDCRILVRGDVRQSRVFIQVQGASGAERRRALAIVRDHFQAIHVGIPNLDAKNKVPLPNDPQAPPVDYEFLCRLERQGIERSFFEGAANWYSVAELLNGVDERDFDVFLGHNSHDKPAVRELAKLLREQGQRPWLDEVNLTPGEPWKEEVVTAISSCRAVAILIGPDGMGPWELEETRLALDEAVRLKKRVIPVLLPGAIDDAPHLPAEWRMLAQRTRVNFRNGFNEGELKRLCQGLTK